MIGLCTVTFRDLTVDNIFELAKESQVEAIEWGGDFHLKPGDLEQAQYIKEQTAVSNIKYMTYGSYYYLQLNHNFQAVLETAARLGADKIRVWAGQKPSAEANEAYWQDLIAEAQELANHAKAVGIGLAFEYHAGTLTDTAQTALRLMESIGCDNVSLYWQPAENLSVQERLDSLPKLIPYLSNVHVFHWENYLNRFALAEGEEEWQAYLQLLSKEDRAYYLEFVKGDSVAQFKEDLKTLKNWRAKL